MSLRPMDLQPTLFGSMPAIAGELFAENDRYRLFAQKVWPVLAGTRDALEKIAEVTLANIADVEAGRMCANEVQADRIKSA